MITFLRNCLLIDGTEADPVENAGLVVEDERIVAAGAGAASKAADRTIDMRGMAVLPGLINLHTHYGLKLPGALSAMYASETQAGLAYRMAQNAREGLMVGVTTSRSTGEQRGVDFDLRRWIDSGRLPGPRMFTAGRGLAITGGHGSREAGLVIECDGPDEFRKAARGQIKEGADHIKIMISGGIAGEREAIADAQMAPEEMAAVTSAAHNAGKKVCAHSGAPRAMMQAIEAGVDCMEHGYFLDDEVAASMVEHGTFLVPTICVSRAEEYMKRIGVPQWMIKKSLDAGEKHWEGLQTAIRHKVTIAMGTDMLPADPNDGTYATYREMELMHEAGMTARAVIGSATSVASRVVAFQDHIGTLEAGKLADVIACPGDPSTNLKDLRGLCFVMKGGEIVRQDEG